MSGLVPGDRTPALQLKEVDVPSLRSHKHPIYNSPGPEVRGGSGGSEPASTRDCFDPPEVGARSAESRELGPDVNSTDQRIPGKLAACNYGLRSINYGLPWGMVQWPIILGNVAFQVRLTP